MQPVKFVHAHVWRPATIRLGTEPRLNKYDEDVSGALAAYSFENPEQLYHTVRQYKYFKQGGQTYLSSQLTPAEAQRIFSKLTEHEPVS